MTGERIAKLVAHLDDAGEGMVVLELLRKEACGEGVRIVDLLYRGDVVIELNKHLGLTVERDVITAYVDALAKLRAQFDNFRRRSEQERKNLIYYFEKGKL